MLNTLRKKFKTPDQAEAHYFPKKLVSSDPTPGGQELQVTPGVATPSDFTLFTPNQQLQAVSDLFREYCSTHSSVVIPDDFLKMTVSAMEQLKSSGRSNVVYGLSMALGTKRKDQTDSLLPSKRMPMGLIEHCVNFFCSSSIHEVCLFLSDCYS